MTEKTRPTTEQRGDPALVAMFACYLSRPRIAWPYLAVLFAAMGVLVAALFLPL